MFSLDDNHSWTIIAANGIFCGESLPCEPRGVVFGA